jgi:SpoIVB peptidase S55
MRWVSLAVLFGLIGALAPGAAQAASCLTNIMPVDEVATAASAPAGLDARGLTVARGTTPESFDVKVLGVLQDGIAPGVDMIIVDTESTALDAAGGIWAGMSGSPVYADADDRLIGAVAFGLSLGPSKIGGLAAAEDMNKVLGLPVAAPQTVALTSSLRKEVMATGDVTARQAASGLRRLPIPFAVSGLGNGRLRALTDRLPGSERFLPHSASAAAAAPGNPAEIVPGGNFAAALSYGDITAAGVGTTTARCGNSVVAFGHPMNFDGPTALSAHTATAIVIQDDPAFVPYKLANIGGVVGTLDQDRLSGVRTLLGPAPTPIPVRSSVTDGSAGRDGLTDVNRTRDVPYVAPFHLLANLDRVWDRIAGGRITVGWTVVGTAAGKPFSLTRTNKFADSFDVSFSSIFEMSDMLGALADNRFADVQFNSVDIHASGQPQFLTYRITGVQRRVGSRWRRLKVNSPLKVEPGAKIRLRVLLAADRGTAAIPPVHASLKVPANIGRKQGSLEVTGGFQGAEGFPGEEGLGGPGGLPGSDEVKSFGELVADLEDTPQNNEVRAELRLATRDEMPPPVASVRRTLAEVVSGGMRLPVRVVPPRPKLSVSGKRSFELATALRRGIKLTVRTSAAGRVRLMGLVDRKTARRMNIKRKAKGAVVVAAAGKRVHAGRNRVKLVFTKQARERLADATRLKLAILTTIRSVNRTTATDRFKVTLRRKLG